MLNKQDIFITPADRYLVNKMSPKTQHPEIINGHTTHIHTPSGGQTTVVNQYYNDDSHFLRDIWLLRALDRPYYYHPYPFYRPSFYDAPRTTSSNGNSKSSSKKKDGKDYSGSEIIVIALAAMAAAYAGYKGLEYNLKKIGHALGNLRTPRKIFKSLTRFLGFGGGAFLGAKGGIAGAKWLLDVTALTTGVEIFSALSVGFVGGAIGIAAMKFINRYNPFLGNDKYNLRYGSIQKLAENPHFCLSEGQALMINSYLLGKIDCAKSIANHPDIILRDKRLLNLFTTLRKEGLKEGNPHALLSLKEYLETEERQMQDLLKNADHVSLPEGVCMKTVKENQLHLQYMLGKITPEAYKHALNQYSAPSEATYHYQASPQQSANANMFHAYKTRSSDQAHNAYRAPYSNVTPEPGASEEQTRYYRHR